MVHERLKKITQCEPWLSTEPCTNHTNWIERLRSRCHAGSPAAILGILNPEKKKNTTWIPFLVLILSWGLLSPLPSYYTLLSSHSESTPNISLL